MIRIGNDAFSVPTPGGMRSFALQQRIIPVAGRVASVFLQLVGGAKDLPSLLEADVLRVLPQAMPHVGEIFASMPPGELEAITRILLGPGPSGEPGAVCDRNGLKLPLFGAPGGDTFDMVMQGRTVDTWKLLWHALEVWYPDFFGRARTFLAPGAKEKPSEASATSTTSGQASA